MKQAQEYNSDEAYIDSLTTGFAGFANIRLVCKDQLLETHRNYTLEFSYDPTPWEAKIMSANSDYDVRRQKWKEGLFTGERDEKQEKADPQSKTHQVSTNYRAGECKVFSFHGRGNFAGAQI